MMKRKISIFANLHALVFAKRKNGYMVGTIPLLGFVQLLFLMTWMSNVYPQVNTMSLPSGGEGYKDMLRTDIVPPSPTAASLLAYTNVGNNFAKGTINLSISLFDASNEEIKLPITLNYNYDGFKPYQQIGWTGMGWNLIAGGSISRIPFGHLDDTDPTGRNYKDSYVQSQMSNANTDQEFMHKVNDGGFYDTEPDVFEYSFAGYSGRFISFKGKFYCMPNNKFRITGGSSSFVITTEDGTKYTFGATESTSHKVNGEPYTLPTYTSTWHLTKIESRSGKTVVEFQYTSDGTVEQGGGISQTYKKVAAPHASHSSLSPISSTFATRVSTLRLARVNTPKYSILFGGGASREDLTYVSGTSKVLESLQILNTEGVPVKHYTFHYGYFGSGTAQGKYLKLHSIEEVEISQEATDPIPIDSLRKNRHVFSYHTENGSFPNKHLANVDVNGYYTGRGLFQGVLVPNTYYPNGPDRSPALTGTLMGALKKIEYPTGGHTGIDYELNVKNTGIRYQKISYGVVLQAGGAFTGDLPLIQKRFVIDETQDVAFLIKRKAITPYADNHTRNNAIDFYLYSVTSDDIYNLVHTYKVSYESDSVGVWVTRNLPPGIYEARVDKDVKEEYVTCEFSYLATSDIPIVGGNTSGLRMKSQVVDSGTGEKIHKTYHYVNDLGFSTGVDHRPDFSVSSYQELLYENGATTPTEMNATIYGSTIAQSGAFGQTYYYQSVDELQVSGQDTLKTRYTFRDYLREYNMDVDPETVITYRKSSTGFVPLHKKESTYKVEVDTFFNYLKVRQIKGVSGMTGPFTGLPYEYVPQLGVHYQAWKAISSEKEYRYDDAVPTVVQKELRYDHVHRNLKSTKMPQSNGSELIVRYKYPEDYVATISGIFLNANVRDIVLEEQRWRKNGADSVLVGLDVTQYDPTIFKPLKLFRFEGGVSQLNAETKTGGLFNQLLSDNRLSERVAFTYNGHGRLISQKLKDGPSRSYMYGYTSNPSLPGVPAMPLELTGQVENAAANEFFYEGFEDSGTIGDAHTGARYHAGNYSLSWPRPNGKPYIIDYWALKNNKWSYYRQVYPGSFSLSSVQGVDDVRIYPADALATTYTYYPGVGLRSQVLPGGETSYFSYDGFNRLKQIQDHDQYVKSAYAYHYVNVEDEGGSNPPVQPSMLYAKLAKGSSGQIVDNGVLKTYQPYSVSFFVDEACTVPFILLNPVQIKFKEKTTITSNVSSTQILEYEYYREVPAGVSNDTFLTGWNYCEGGLIVSRAGEETAKDESKTATVQGLPPGGGGEVITCYDSIGILLNWNGYTVKP